MFVLCLALQILCPNPSTFNAVCKRNHLSFWSWLRFSTSLELLKVRIEVIQFWFWRILQLKLTHTVCNIWRCLIKTSNTEWLHFRLQRSFASVSWRNPYLPSVEFASELQWPKHTNLDTSSSLFFSGLFEDMITHTNCKPNFTHWTISGLLTDLADLAWDYSLLIYKCKIYIRVWKGV